MNPKEIRALYDLLKKYEQEKCEQHNKVCYHHYDGETEYCPAFAVDYDDDGCIVGGSCVISWLLEDLRSK